MCTSMYAHQTEYTNTDGHKSGSAFKRKHETNAKNANSKAIEQQQSFYIVRVNNRVRGDGRKRDGETEKEI